MSHAMRIEPRGTFERRRGAHSRRFPKSGSAWLAALERPGSDVVLVVADEPLGAVIAELYRAYGYEVRMPATPLDLIQTLLRVGDRIGAAVISPDARWADGLRDFMADEYPDIDRIVLAA